MGGRLAHVLTVKDALDYIPILQRYGIAKIMAPAPFTGKTLTQAGFGRKSNWGIMVLLIQRQDEIIVTPAETEVIQDGDILITAGMMTSLKECLTKLKRSPSNIIKTYKDGAYEPGTY